MGYRVYHVFSDGTREDILERIFITETKAEKAAIQAAEDYALGGEILRMTGIEPCEADIIDWEIVEEKIICSVWTFIINDL